MAAKRYGIQEASVLLNRSASTLRSWDRNQSMPEKLRPLRDDLGHRYWTPTLIAQIKKWMEANDFYPGRGIDYAPTPERLEQHIDRIRSSRSSTL